MPSAFQRKSGTSRKRATAGVVATAATPGGVGLQQKQLPESTTLLASSTRSNTAAAAASNDASLPFSRGATNSSNNKRHHRPPLRGVKPWQGGTYLTSTGLNDLDNILGGGQLLGTCMLLREDRLAGTRELALTLVKYWCAEGISQGHDLIIPTFSSEKKNQDDNNDDDPLSFLEESSSDYDEYKNEEEFQQHLWRNLKQELRHLILSLPRNLHWDKERKKQDKQQKEAQAVQEAVKKADINSGLSMMSLGGPMSILEEDEEDEEEETKQQDDDNLEVAWQYKKSVQQERLAKSKSTNTTASNLVLTDVFCHSYDLSARMKDQIVNQLQEEEENKNSPSSTSTLDPSSYLCELSWKNEKGQSSSHASGYTLFSDLVQLLNDKLSSLSSSSAAAAEAAQSNDESQTQSHYQTKAIRLLLFHPPMPSLATALPLLISHIRSRELAVVIMVVHAPPCASELSTTFKVARSADIVLSTEGFAGRSHYPPPAEFRHLLGVLKISKTTRKRTECAANIYGFKRDRRKLHIPLLHIPPEDYAEGGSSTSGVRSGGGKRETTSSSGAASTTKKQSGGMGCSSNLSGYLLDF